MIRVQAWIEFAIGGTLAALTIVLFANARLCFFNEASCGMVEPIAGMYALVLALPLLLAGWLAAPQRAEFSRKSRVSTPDSGCSISVRPGALMVVATTYVRFRFSIADVRMGRPAAGLLMSAFDPKRPFVVLDRTTGVKA